MRDDALYRAPSSSDVKLPGEGDLECAKRLCCVECGTKEDTNAMILHALTNRHNMCFHVLHYKKSWKHPERILWYAAVYGNKTALLGILHIYETDSGELKRLVDSVVDTETGKTALMLSCEHGHEQCTRALIQKGADVTKIVSFKKSVEERQYDDALILSCERGHEQCVFALLRAVENMDYHTKTSFMNSNETKHATKYCTEQGYASILDALITAGANVEMTFKEELKKTLLMRAAERGRLECVATLIDQRANLDKKLADGSTALMIACKNGHSECVGRLVDASTTGGNFDMKALFDITTEFECLLMLLSKGANISLLEGVIPLMNDCYTQNTLDASGDGVQPEALSAVMKKPAGFTALMLSCVKGHHSCVHDLLQVDSSQRHIVAQSCNATAWTLACRFGHHECLWELIESVSWTEKHVYIDQILREDNTTALLLCAEKGYDKCVQTLIDGNANIGHLNSNGNTALHQAASFGHNDVVRILIDAKATVDVHNNEELTPLMVACRDGHTECAETLLTKGAIVDAHLEDESHHIDETAYTMAARAGHLSCISMLLETKSEYSSITNAKRHTPLILAAQAGHVECVQKLIDEGEDIAQTSPNLENDGGFGRGTATYFALMNQKDHCVRVLLRKDPTTYNHAGMNETMIQCRLLERMEYSAQLPIPTYKDLSLPHKLALMIDSYAPDVSSGTSSETQTISLIRRSTPEFTSMNHVKHMFVSKWSRQSNVTDRRQSNVTDRILSNPELSNAIQTKMSNAIRDAAMYVEMRDTSRQTPKRPRLYGEQLETSVEQRIAGMSDESKKKHSKDITFTQTELHAVHTDHLKPNDCIKVNDEFFQFQDYDIDSSIVLDPDLVFEHRDYCKESLFTCPALRNWVDVFFTSNANQLMFGKAHLVLIQFNAMFYSPGKGGFSKASQSFDANALMQTL